MRSLTFRRPLLVTATLLALLFMALTIVVSLGWTGADDLAVTRWLQALPWGPLQLGFRITDEWDGLRQVVLALIAIAIILALDRRLGVVAVFCSGADLAWFLLELAVGRPRPDAHLVHVARHASGGTYPSGHAVYYFWTLTLLALAISPRLPKRLRLVPLLAAVLAYAVVCLGRIVEGEHWPSDVAGGALLAGAWTLAVLSAGWKGSARSARRRTSAARAL